MADKEKEVKRLEQSVSSLDEERIKYTEALIELHEAVKKNPERFIDPTYDNTTEIDKLQLEHGIQAFSLRKELTEDKLEMRMWQMERMKAEIDAIKAQRRNDIRWFLTALIALIAIAIPIIQYLMK